MSKPLYEKPYRFMDPPDTPVIKEKVIQGTDDPNIYGEVVYSKGELRVREKDGLVSIWVGAKLEATVRT